MITITLPVPVWLEHLLGIRDWGTISESVARQLCNNAGVVFSDNVGYAGIFYLERTSPIAFKIWNYDAWHASSEKRRLEKELSEHKRQERYARESQLLLIKNSLIRANPELNESDYEGWSSRVVRGKITLELACEFIADL
jgi:hypothetical protein